MGVQYKRQQESPSSEYTNITTIPSRTKSKALPSKGKMPAQLKQHKAAVVTAEPGWFDLELSVRKTIY
jgi:hypothetical protein